MKTSSNINTGVNSLSMLNGMAKRTYSRVMAAMAEDKDASMCHTFAALTDGAKAIALQSGHYSNTYIRGNAKGMEATAAAEELEAKAAAKVERKLRKIDHTIAVAFLAEYITRQRKADEPTQPETSTPNPDNTMNANNAPEYEETHAARCLHIYLNNTADIYHRYTVPAIEATAKQMRVYEYAKTLPAGYAPKNNSNAHPKDIASAKAMPALFAAIQLVKKHDHLTPTPADVEFVKADYVAYIIECAQYEIANA